MGNSCAPSYAKLYLGGWERQVFSEYKFTIYLKHVLFWYRFFEDLLLVWTGSSQLLQEFIQVLNSNSMNLHFTFNFDDTQIPCLGSLDHQLSGWDDWYNLYCKSTAGNTLLHASSVHPRPLVRSIPYAVTQELC